MKRIKEIKLLLSAWDEPRQGENVYRIMEQGLDYLQRIHSAVIRVADRKGFDDPMQICCEAIKELGLLQTMANPLVCRSFLSSLAAEAKKPMEIERKK